MRGGRQLVFLGLSLVFASRFFPLAHPTTHCLTVGDPALMCWSLQWVSHALVHDPLHLFRGNIFYPYSHAVVLTDAMTSLAVLNIPVRLFTDNPWVGYNLLIVLAFYLSALSGAWLAEEVSGSRLVGFWGGIFWGFLFFRIHHFGHLQMLSFQGIPAAVVCLLRWWRQPRARSALLFSVVFVAQALVSWYLAAILGVTVAVVAVAHATRVSISHVRTGLLAALVCAAVILPVAWPYTTAFGDSSVADRKALVATFGDAVRPADYLTPPDVTLIGHGIPGNRHWLWQENTLYIGYAALALALVGLFRARGAGAERRWVVAGVLLVVAGYVLALGFVSPRLHFRLPLHFLATALPFVAGLRATQRFSLVLYVGVLILSSLGLGALVARMRSRRAGALLVGVLSAVFLVEVFPLYLPFGTAAPWAFTEPDRAIAKVQHGAGRQLVVLHLPIYYGAEAYPVSEAGYLVNSTAHWAWLVNGFSGGEPAGFHERMRVLARLPDESSVAELRRLGVDVLAVHAAETVQRRRELAAFFRKQSWASVVPLPTDEFLVLLAR